VCDTTELPGDQAGPLQLALANALLRAARFADAETAATQALAAGSDRETVGQLRWILIQSCINQGRVQAALDEAQRPLDGGTELSRAERARFHGLAAQCLHVVSTSGPGPAMQEAEGARDEGLASGDAYAMAYGLQAVAGASRWQGRFSQGVDVAGQATAALEQAGPITDSQLDPLLIRANCLFDLDRDAEAREAYAGDLRFAERGIGTFFLCFHHLSVARMLFLTGRWDDALTEISSAREVPDHLGLTVHLDGLAAPGSLRRQARGGGGERRGDLVVDFLEEMIRSTPIEVIAAFAERSGASAPGECSFSPRMPPRSHQPDEARSLQRVTEGWEAARTLPPIGAVSHHSGHRQAPPITRTGGWLSWLVLDLLAIWPRPDKASQHLPDLNRARAGRHHRILRGESPQLLLVVGLHDAKTPRAAAVEHGTEDDHVA
jgi:tetratricopeptide (TPR) repeat protein